MLPEDPSAERSHISVALIQAPNGPRIPQLLTAIIAALGRDVAARRTTPQLRNETYKANRPACSDGARPGRGRLA
jgi:hypothetical protein